MLCIIIITGFSASVSLNHMKSKILKFSIQAAFYLRSICIYCY